MDPQSNGSVAVVTPPAPSPSSPPKPLINKKLAISNKLEAFDYFGLRSVLIPPRDTWASTVHAGYKLSAEYGVRCVDAVREDDPNFSVRKVLDRVTKKTRLQCPQENTQLALAPANTMNLPSLNPTIAADTLQLTVRPLAQRQEPKWRPPWKLSRVISGHTGWVWCVAVDHTNHWFATGSSDRLIKIWDLASGQLKLSLTGHINAVKDIEISNRHPYLFSVSDDHTVKCWDLEQNKVVRSYHGHLSGVYKVALHKSLNVLATGGRDAVIRVWDMRTRLPVHVLGGHKHTIMSLVSQDVEPQFISGSQDKTVRLWDLAAGTCRAVLTNHKHAVRGLATHPHEYTFASAAADHIKAWVCPDGKFQRNFSHFNSILHCVAIKGDSANDSIVVAGCNSGQLHFWDWKSGAKFQTLTSPPQPGSLDSEAAIFDCAFDFSESRLITAECDKTIKIWKEDDDAAPDTHPITWLMPPRSRRF